MSNSVEIISPSGFPPRIGTFLGMLEDVRRATRRMVEGMTSAQVEWHPQSNVESIGTLLLHIAAVEFSWIQEDIMHKPMGEEWMIAFPIRFNMPQITGQPLGYFLGKLDSVRAETKTALRTLTDKDLERMVSPQDEGTAATSSYSIEWILYHLIEHEAHHKGQIAVMKRMLPE